MSDLLFVNGNLYSWSSTIFTIGTERFTGLTSVSYGQKRARTHGWGMSKAHKPRGRTAGKYTPEPLKIKCYPDTAQDIRTYLRSLSTDGRSYGNVSVDASLQLYEPTLGEIYRLFIGAALESETQSHEESADAVQEEWEFSIMAIMTDGLGTLYDSSQGI